MTDPAADGLKALADLWTAQGTAMLQAQHGIARSMSESMGKFLGTAGAGSTPDLSPPDLAKATEAVGALWSAATGLSADLVKRLTEATGGSAGMFDTIADPRHWMAGTGATDGLLARSVDAPRLADLFDVERRYATVAHRWAELRQRSLEHQRVLLEAWMQAGRTYLEELADRNRANEEPLEPKQAMALWSEIGNRTMVAAQRSEPFLRSQRETIRASTALRLAQAELSEHIGKQFGLPTRTELDDVHRTVTEMRRELRRTRRELDALKAVAPPSATNTLPAAASPAPSPVSTRRKAR